MSETEGGVATHRLDRSTPLPLFMVRSPAHNRCYNVAVGPHLEGIARCASLVDSRCWPAGVGVLPTNGATAGQSGIDKIDGHCGCAIAVDERFAGPQDPLF